MTFSNPRRVAEIYNWPIGRQRCTARFVVESDPKRGERVARYTQDKARTGWNKPKRTTYAHKAAIVDGDDGRTYILLYNAVLASVAIWLSDMQHIAEYVHYTGEPQRYETLKALVCEVQP